MLKRIVLHPFLMAGWAAVRETNRQLALRGRAVLCNALGIEPPCADDMLGSLASLPLPDGDGRVGDSPLDADPFQDRLLQQFRIEVPVIPWPAPPKRLIRISGQVYNRDGDYESLGRALRVLGCLCRYRDSNLDVQSRSNAAAARLAAMGVKKGDRVVFIAHNHPDWPLAFFGIVRAGATAVPSAPCRGGAKP